MAIASNASISSLMRMAPSCAVAPAPMVAASATPGRRRHDEPDVEEGAQKPSESLDPDVGQRVVALHGDQRAGGQRQKPDDDHGAADDGQRPGAHPQNGDQPQYLTWITPNRVDG